MLTNFILKCFVPHYKDGLTPEVRVRCGIVSGVVCIVCNLLLAAVKFSLAFTLTQNKFCRFDSCALKEIQKAVFVVAVASVSVLTAANTLFKSFIVTGSACAEIGKDYVFNYYFFLRSSKNRFCFSLSVIRAVQCNKNIIFM